MMLFIIWAICGLIFMGLGIHAWNAERPAGFWANAKPVEVENIRSYNRAMGKLWLGFGILFILLGLPLLVGQNSPWVFVSVVGCMFECIVLAIAYTKIENKYRKR